MLKHFLSIMRTPDGEDAAPLSGGALVGSNAVDIVYPAHLKQSLPQCMVGEAGGKVTNPQLEAMDMAILDPLHDRSGSSCQAFTDMAVLMKTVHQCHHLAVL